MSSETLALYNHFHDETGNPLAASNLTLAHVMLMQNRTQHEIALTVEEVAQRLKVSPKKVYQMVKADEIPHSRIGGQIRIAPTAIDSLMRCLGERVLSPNSPRGRKTHRPLLEG